MKKFISVLTTTICVVLCTLWLAGCNTGEDKSVEVTGIAFDRTEIMLTEGDEYILTATIMPSNATDQTMEWSSSNTAVATVDNGSVVAVTEGEATITGATKNGKTASCTVTVEAKREDPPAQFTVTFYAEGGEFEDGTDTYEMQVIDGEKLSCIPVTRGDKYIFTNWYKDEFRDNLWNLEEDTVTEDTKLFAGWKYLNKYQSVIDALAEKMTTERQDVSAAVEILSIFKDSNGYFCFVEKDDTGVFSYKTNICNFDKVAGNTEIIPQISNTTLTQIKNYNDYYTSENNSYLADSMAYRYTCAENVNEAIIYSCVSPMELDTEGHFTTNGPWYCCKVKAIIADDDGKIFDCSFTVVAGTYYIDAVVNGTALSEEFDVIILELGEIANDYYAEHLMEIEA